VNRHGPGVVRQALLAIVVGAAVACVPATPVPSGAQVVHIAITPSSVTLQPDSVRAGDVYLELDAPESAPFTFVASTDTPNATPGPLTPDQLAGVRTGNLFHTVTVAFNAGGCSTSQDAAARGTTGECGNVRKVTVAPGTYVISAGDPAVVGTPLAVLTVTP
jgi:hypothetical protein